MGLPRRSVRGVHHRIRRLAHYESQRASCPQKPRPIRSDHRQGGAEQVVEPSRFEARYSRSARHLSGPRGSGFQFRRSRQPATDRFCRAKPCPRKFHQPRRVISASVASIIQRGARQGICHVEDASAAAGTPRPFQAWGIPPVEDVRTRSESRNGICQTP